MYNNRIPTGGVNSKSFNNMNLKAFGEAAPGLQIFIESWGENTYEQQ